MATQTALLLVFGLLVRGTSAAGDQCTSGPSGTLDRHAIANSPGCLAECKQFLDNTVCDAEQITCASGGLFVPALCQPQVSCTTTIADELPRHLPANDSAGWRFNNVSTKVVDAYSPPLGDGPEWDAYNGYLTRCSCGDDRYGFDCSMVKFKQCKSGQVWDGTFRNVGSEDKPHTCFLLKASSQTSSSVRPALETVRNNRVSIKIAPNADVYARSLVQISMLGRFRPGGQNQSSCGIWSSMDAGQPFNCDFFREPGTDSCKLPVSTADSGHPWVFPTNEQVQRASGECCSSVHQWLALNMSCVIRQCSNDTGLMQYECDQLALNVSAPGQLDQGMQAWLDLGKALAGVQSALLTFDQVSHQNGTSSSTNLTFLPTDSATPPASIQMQCMTGSCLQSATLPQSWQKAHPSATFLNQTIGCEPLPPPPESQRSSSTLALIVLLSLALLSLNLCGAGLVFYRAHRLQAHFGEQPQEHMMRGVLEPTEDAKHQSLLQQDSPTEALGPVACPEVGPPVGLLFEQVSYDVPGFSRTVVVQASGHIPSHQMVAVLGPSGAGKSSLLDILASRPKVGAVANANSVRVFGNQGTRLGCKGVGYAMQDDFLCPEETVLESLLFAARVQLVGWSEERVHSQVRRVIDLLHLHKITNTMVGSSAEGGGISGGERKRVSIGVELVAAPSLLILDEPTSGLDSASTAIVLSGLRAVADAGCSTVFSIHQPPFEQFVQFDQVILMSRLGENIFTGRPSSCTQYFQELCAREEIQLPEAVVQAWSNMSTSPRGFDGTQGNPAEFLLNTASIDSDEALHQLHQLFVSSREFEETVLHPNQQVLASCQGTLCTPRDMSKPVLHGVQALGLLTARATRATVRNPALFVSQMAVTVLIAVFMAVLANKIQMDFTGVQTKSFLLNFLVLFQGMVAFSSLGSLLTHRDVFIRERAAHLYPGWPYLLSKVLTDFLPLRLLPSVALSFIVYWFCGFRDNDHAFGQFMLTLSLGNCTSAAICFFIASICSSIGTANLLSAAAVIYNFAFSGLLITSGTELANRMRFSSIFFYQWEALMAVEFYSGPCPTDGSGPDCNTFIFNPTINGQVYSNSITVSTQAVLDNFSLHSRYGQDIFLLLLYCGSFLFASALVLQFTKYRK